MIEILTHQAEFLKSNAVHTGLVAGFGSGKSIAATIKTIREEKAIPEHLGSLLFTYLFADKRYSISEL